LFFAVRETPIHQHETPTLGNSDGWKLMHPRVVMPMILVL
jgi:hypothetical protein